MRKRPEKSMLETSVFTALFIITVALTVYLVADTLRADPAGADTAATALFYTAAGVVLCTVTVILQNLRDRKARELRNIEHIMQQLKSMAVLWDTSFTYVRVNESFTRNTGYTAEELLDPETLKNILPPEAFSSNLQGITDSRDEEFQIKTKTGGTVPTVWNTSIISSYPGKIENTPILLSIGPDLTEANKMRQKVMAYSKKLKESENRYELSMDLSEIGLLMKEKGSSRFYVSPQLCRMLGISSADGYVEGEMLREVFHPRDRLVFDTFASGKKSDSRKLEHGEIHSVDFRALSADGNYHWYNFRYQSPKTGSLAAGGAVMDITVDKEKDLMIERMAYIDDVTQIYNRNKFMLMGSEILECSRNDENMNYWVIVLDIDSFHIINDTCGYNNGNYLLKEIAAVLISNITEGGFTARIGGDNFALLIKADGDDLLPVRIIRRIQKDIAGIGGMGLENQNITCSAGYCLMSDSGGADFAQVLDRAEFALSLADDTRSSIQRYDSHAHDTIIAGNAIEMDLAKALDNNELVLFYQPKINLDNGSVMGMEALIRWIKPDGKVVPPGDFIPVAESSLLITRISQFVLYEACRQNKKWQDMGLEPLTVSINLSAIDFYQTNVTDSIKKALAETGLPPQYLDVELTESLALKDIDHAIIQMQEIKDLGVKLSMDDFGTGYSSLSYIQMLPITLLKLDRSFIMYLEEDEISREIVSAVIRIAKSKKIETVAEGIETIGQGEILKKSGCDYAQGYFFGKPMPADEFEEFLRSRQGRGAPAGNPHI